MILNYNTYIRKKAELVDKKTKDSQRAEKKKLVNEIAELKKKLKKSHACKISRSILCSLFSFLSGHSTSGATDTLSIRLLCISLPVLEMASILDSIL